MSANGSHQDVTEPLAAQFPDTVEAVDDAKAWELVDSQAGQYMPRRIRGSCRGRALGWNFIAPPGSGDNDTVPPGSGDGDTVSPGSGESNTE